MGISVQAWVILVVYAIVTVVAIVAMFMQFNIWYLIPFVIWLIHYGIQVYDTNCLTVGNCSVWSWIRTIFNIIGPILLVILVIYSFATKDRSNDEERNTTITFEEF